MVNNYFDLTINIRTLAELTDLQKDALEDWITSALNHVDLEGELEYHPLCIESRVGNPLYFESEIE